jgi:hypothetical protein
MYFRHTTSIHDSCAALGGQLGVSIPGKKADLFQGAERLALALEVSDGHRAGSP